MSHYENSVVYITLLDKPEKYKNIGYMELTARLKEDVGINMSKTKIRQIVLDLGLEDFYTKNKFNKHKEQQEQQEQETNERLYSLEHELQATQQRVHKLEQNVADLKLAITVLQDTQKYTKSSFRAFGKCPP